MNDLKGTEVTQTDRKKTAICPPQAMPIGVVAPEDFAEILEIETVKTPSRAEEVVVAVAQVGGLIIVEVVKVGAEVVKVIAVGVVELAFAVVKTAVVGLVNSLLWRDPPADNDWPTKSRPAERPNIHIVNNVTGATGDVTIVNNVNTKP